MHAQLIAIALHVFAAFGLATHPNARALAEADATAVESRTRPAGGESPAVDVGDVALYQVLESRLDIDAVAYDPMAGGGMSCGPLMQRCPFVWRSSLVDQVRAWLWAEEHSSLAGVDSSSTRAAKRHARARELVAEAVAGMVSDGDAEWVAEEP